jgi:hypothetical protein
MMSHRLLPVLALAAGIALAGCSSSSTLSRYTHDTPEAASRANIYADGTGPGAEALERAETRRQASRAPRPAAPTARAEDLSARTVGSRTQAQGEALKPYSEEWWDKENREDARLRQRMNICRGC